MSLRGRWGGTQAVFLFLPLFLVENTVSVWRESVESVESVEQVWGTCPGKLLLASDAGQSPSVLGRTCSSRGGHTSWSSVQGWPISRARGGREPTRGLVGVGDVSSYTEQGTLGTRPTPTWGLQGPVAAAWLQSSRPGLQATGADRGAGEAHALRPESASSRAVGRPGVAAAGDMLGWTGRRLMKASPLGVARGQKRSGEVVGSRDLGGTTAQGRRTCPGRVLGGGLRRGTF